MKSVFGFDVLFVFIFKIYDGDFFEGLYLKIENFFFIFWYFVGYCVLLVIELLFVLY